MLDKRATPAGSRPGSARRVRIGGNGRSPWSAAKVVVLVAAPALAVSTAVATWWAVDHIEDSLRTETRRDLAAAGIDPSGLEIEFDYRDGSASGALPPGVTVAAAVAAVDADLLDDFDGSGLVVAPTPTATPRPTPTPAPTPTPEPTPQPTPTPSPTPTPTPEPRGSTEVTVRVDDPTIEIVGTVLTEKQRVSLVSIAGRAFGLANLVDELGVSELEPAVADADGRVAALRQFIGAMAAVLSAEATLTDDELVVSVVVPDQVTGNFFVGLAAVTTSVPTTVDVTVAEVPTSEQVGLLQVELDALSSEIVETVVFPPGSSELSSGAEATLDLVAAAMERHPAPVVEVAGHTDSSGDAAANLTLSAFRAQAVEAYLVSVGVDPDRLMSRGAGDTEPIDDNSTPEGRARNRRVVFTALIAF